MNTVLHHEAEEWCRVQRTLDELSSRLDVIGGARSHHQDLAALSTVRSFGETDVAFPSEVTHGNREVTVASASGEMRHGHATRDLAYAAMQIPENYRCSVCLTAAQEPLAMPCPHRLCVPCAALGHLAACPICGAALPAERTLDTTFAAEIASTRLSCQCGEDVLLLEVDEHSCEHTRRAQQLVQCATTSTPARTPNRSTFVCPLCAEPNLSREGLLEHCSRCHSGVTRAAICPICAATPWGDASYESENFVKHLTKRHKCDYDVLADYAEDEEAILRRVLAESMPPEEDEDEVLAMVLRESAAAHASS